MTPADASLYVALLAAAFIAATILPGQSEALLAAMVVGGHPPWLLVAIASVGNVLGSILNWALGRGIERFSDRAWFPLRGAMLERTQRWYARYGKWSLLASWVPVIGDALTVVAEVMRERPLVFVLLVTLAKVGRYIVVATAASALR